MRIHGRWLSWGLAVSVLGGIPAQAAWQVPQRVLPQPVLRVPTTQLSIGLHYEKARPFREGLAAVRQSGRWGFIDRDGDWVIPPRFDQVREFQEGLAPALAGELWGFIDRGGDWVIPPRFSRVNSFRDGLATVWQGSRAGVITPAGEMVIPMGRFYAIGEFQEEGAAAMDRSGRWGVIDRTGGWVVPPQFSSVGTFSEGLAAAAVKGQRGYINRQGTWVIPPQYDTALSFSHGLGLVSMGGKWGFINRAGEIVIPLKYDQAFSFAEGLAVVEKDGKQFYINVQGEPVLESPLNLGAGVALNFSNRLAPVGILGEKEQWGFMDRSGDLVIPPQFERVTFFSEGLAAVAIGDRWGYVRRVSLK